MKQFYCQMKPLLVTIGIIFQIIIKPSHSFLSPLLNPTINTQYHHSSFINNPTLPYHPSSIIIRTKHELAISSTELNRSSTSLEQTNGSPFDLKSLFPDPTWDHESIHRDLYEVLERDSSALNRENITFSNVYRFDNDTSFSSFLENSNRKKRKSARATALMQKNNNTKDDATNDSTSSKNNKNVTVDREMTKMVEDRMYGYQRNDYETLIRYGRSHPLKVNADKLTYYAKKAFRRRNYDEAIDFYNQALNIDPRDGRAYLGLSRIAERRKELNLARDWLRQGIAHSVTTLRHERMNPFLLQALGCLEERAGNLAEAETLYIESVKIRPWHAASWVSLAQLRIWKLRRGVASGRVCYQTAVYELNAAGAKPNSYVYTAWARMEYEVAGDIRTARTLFQRALDIDPKSSAAWFQLGLMESSTDNYSKAQECFDAVLSFDPNNSRVLQAYAIMESKRVGSSSRHVIDLFEKALKVRGGRFDAGVYQAYALYVATLGNIEGARDLFRRGTEIDKTHAPVWQAWGVLETKYGTPEEARRIFQQGIWSCAQSSAIQSGGRHCARLWQAWGILEKQTEDYSTARKCFNRALDADPWNVPSITAWAKMEEELGNVIDARSVFERSLKQFSSKSSEKKGLWRAYELMESRLGNTRQSQIVYNRYIRESINKTRSAQADDGFLSSFNDLSTTTVKSTPDHIASDDGGGEIEVYQISKKDYSFVDGEVWMNNGNIEGKIPMARMKKNQKKNSGKNEQL